MNYVAEPADREGSGSYCAIAFGILPIATLVHPCTSSLRSLHKSIHAQNRSKLLNERQ